MSQALWQLRHVGDVLARLYWRGHSQAPALAGASLHTGAGACAAVAEDASFSCRGPMLYTVDVRGGEVWILAAMVDSSLSSHFPTPASKIPPNESHLLVFIPFSCHFHIAPSDQCEYGRSNGMSLTNEVIKDIIPYVLVSLSLPFSFLRWLDMGKASCHVRSSLWTGPCGK